MMGEGVSELTETLLRAYFESGALPPAFLLHLRCPSPTNTPGNLIQRRQAAHYRCAARTQPIA
jgi:hypothetical protein